MYLLQFEKEILNHAVSILNKKLISQVSPMIFSPGEQFISQCFLRHH